MSDEKNISQIAKNEDVLLRLESNDDFKQLVTLPYANYAAAALRKAKEEASKPAMTRDLNAMSDYLREHVLYDEVAKLVSAPLADLRKIRAAKEKAKEQGTPDGPTIPVLPDEQQSA